MATKPEIERLSVLETKVDRAVTDISEIKETVTTEFTSLNAKIDGLDRKFAAKWVQSAVSFVIGIIISAVLVALVALVIVPNNKDGSTGTQSPSTSTTTTTTTPTGSTSTTRNNGSTSSSTPNSANANATSQSDGKKTTDSESSGGVDVTLPKVTP